MIGMEGTRLLREKRGQGRPRRRTAEGGPPAESECLEWKSLHITLSGNRLPFRRLSAKPPQRKRLWGLGYPVFRQECRKSLPSNKDYSKKTFSLIGLLTPFC
ncbi:hypothetical protein E4J71_05425 [Peribacillus frigoritolerans]|nr:hypothetical protein E4J71_05425 [Peribacillus frigoritolerans]